MVVLISHQLMEGNLRGAHSLLVTPSTSSLRAATQTQPLPSVVKDRPSRTGLGLTIPKSRYAQDMSQAAVAPPSYSDLRRQRSLAAVRSLSALNSNGRAQASMSRSASVRETRSYDDAHESRSNDWTSVAGRPLYRISSDPSRTNPESQPVYTATPRGLHRSASTTTDLRVQMHELRGRISSLKERAREDGLRRRSLQNMREPTPFAFSDVWHTGTQGYRSTALSASTRTERSSDSSHSADYLHDPANGRARAKTSSIEVANRLARESSNASVENEESHYEDASSEVDGDLSTSGEQGSSCPSEDGHDDDKLDGDSVYEDAHLHENSPPLAERHEDRADAFDYENFFLHSAMGAHPQLQRTASVSSTDSNRTTRPDSSHRQSSEAFTAPKTGQLTLHHNPSMESLSTVATFATATESLESDDETDDGFDCQPGLALTQDWPISATNNSPPAPLGELRADPAFLVSKDGDFDSGRPSPSTLR